MKLKMIVVDFQIPARAKKWAIRAGIPAVILSVAAVAWADSLHTWNTGDTLQATDLNGNFTNLQAQIAALQSQVHTASGFRAELTSPTSVTGTQEIAFNHVLFDLGGEYNAATGSFTAKQAGVYQLSCGFDFTSAASNNYDAVIEKNGVQFLAADEQASVSGYNINCATSGIVQLAAGDAVTCSAQTTAGAATPISVGFGYRNFFSAARLY